MRVVAAVTSSRADFGLMRHAYAAIDAAADLDLRLVVTGTHLSSPHGRTIGEVRASGLPIVCELDVELEAGSGAGTARTAGRMTCAIAKALETIEPDILILLGDRFEIHAAAVVATAMRIPVVHLCGGEVTEGAVDQVWRNSITKMAHQHLVSTAEHGANVEAMGEEPRRIEIVGAPGLDAIRHLTAASDEELESAIGMPLESPLVLVTFHPPTTLLSGDPDGATQLSGFLYGLRRVPATYVVTGANADAGADRVTELLTRFVEEDPRRTLVPSLGSSRYLQLMRRADAVAGNSSSGLLEAPSFGVPTLDVGSRQRGRIAPASVISVLATSDAVAGGLRRALHPGFRDGLQGLVNPYGDGRTAERVVQSLRTLPLGRDLLVKR